MLTKEEREQIYNEVRLEKILAGAKKRMAKWRETHKDTMTEEQREARREKSRQYYHENIEKSRLDAAVRMRKSRALKKLRKQPL